MYELPEEIPTRTPRPDFIEPSTKMPVTLSEQVFD